MYHPSQYVYMNQTMMVFKFKSQNIKRCTYERTTVSMSLKHILVGTANNKAWRDG